MVYNFNHGVGWASSGVEYAQAYRAEVFRRLNTPAKFIYSDMFRLDNLAHMTRNLGLEDDQVIWLYQYFTDFHTAPCSIPLTEFAAAFEAAGVRKEEKPARRMVRYLFDSEKRLVDLYYSRANEGEEHMLQRAEYICGGVLSRIDYYSYALMFSEFFAPREGKGICFLRRFYNEDGTVAFEELVNDLEKDGRSVFRFPDRIFYSKEELADAMMADLVEKHICEDDLVIIDRSTLWGQPAMRHLRGKRRIVSVIHADHFSEGYEEDGHVLWNNFYEYVFGHMKGIDCFIASTQKQKEVFKAQCEEYVGYVPRIEAIPVGALEKLRYPAEDEGGYGGRKPYSLVTASRLAKEKHVDWIVKAVIRAKEKLPELTLDIYGMGAEEEAIKKIIEEGGAGDYISLKGHQDMEEKYVGYETYVSASTSEGFGLTLMEAVGSGLAMVGYDVPYGNQTFIADRKNGCLIPADRNEDTPDVMVEKLAEGIIRLYKEGNLKKYSKASYKMASDYLAAKIDAKWAALLEEL